LAAAVLPHSRRNRRYRLRTAHCAVGKVHHLLPQKRTARRLRGHPPHVEADSTPFGSHPSRISATAGMLAPSPLQVLLAHTERHAPHTHSAADMNIDRAWAFGFGYAYSFRHTPDSSRSGSRCTVSSRRFPPTALKLAQNFRRGGFPAMGSAPPRQAQFMRT
jgi:hypothetical protein